MGMPEVLPVLLASIMLVSCTHGSAVCPCQIQSDPDFVVDRPHGSPRASILLVHGSAPFNLDGRIPAPHLSSPYGRDCFFRDLSRELVKQGLEVLRYSKPGVGMGSIDADAYATTDVQVISRQLNSLWRQLPAGRPRLVLAWSEGTLHVRTLPLAELDGVILLGAISTNLGSVVAWQGGPGRDELFRQLQAMPRTAMLGLDRPAGRALDELRMSDNWSVFLRRPDLPILVLHGTADREVPVEQARVWRDKLPKHKLRVVLGEGLDHRFMRPGTYELVRLTDEIHAWLNAIFPSS